MSIALAPPDVAHAGFGIARVAPGEALHCTAYARLGIGKTHARWCAPTALCMQRKPIIDIDEAIWHAWSASSQQAFLRALPAGFFVPAPADSAHYTSLHAAAPLAILARKDDVLRAMAIAAPDDAPMLVIDSAHDAYVFQFEVRGVDARARARGCVCDARFTSPSLDPPQTTGALTPTQIVRTATRRLAAKFAELRSAAVVAATRA